MAEEIEYVHSGLFSQVRQSLMKESKTNANMH